MHWPGPQLRLNYPCARALRKTLCQTGTSFLVLQTLLMLTWILIGFDRHWFILIVVFEVISGFIDFCWWLQMSYIYKTFMLLVLVWYGMVSFLFQDFVLGCRFFWALGLPFGEKADLGIDQTQQDDMVIPNGGKGWWQRILVHVFFTLAAVGLHVAWSILYVRCFKAARFNRQNRKLGDEASVGVSSLSSSNCKRKTPGDGRPWFHAYVLLTTTTDCSCSCWANETWVVKFWNPGTF